MLSRLAPSVVRAAPRCAAVASISNSNSLLSWRLAARPLSMIARPVQSAATLSSSAPAAAAAAAPTALSKFEMSPELRAVTDELYVQCSSWDEEKAAKVLDEVRVAREQGGDLAAIATAQKYLENRLKFSDIVKQYGGWYPLLGLGAILLTSKEIFVLSEEISIAGDFFLVTLALYLNMRDPAMEALKAERANIATKLRQQRELEIDATKVLLRAYDNQPMLLSMLRDLKTEVTDLLRKRTQVTFAKQRVAAANAVEKKLEEIFNREQDVAIKAKRAVQAGATPFVLDAYGKLTAAQKAATVDYSIDILCGGKSDVKRDTVRQLYIEYFKNLPAAQK